MGVRIVCSWFGTYVVSRCYDQADASSAVPLSPARLCTAALLHFRAHQASTGVSLEIAV